MRTNGHSQHDLVNEINALKGQLKQLSRALEAEASDGVSSTLSAVETRSKQAIESAIQSAQNFIDEHAHTASDAAGRVAKKTVQMRDAASDSLVEAVEARPFSTLAAVLGLGFLAGYLCRRQ